MTLQMLGAKLQQYFHLQQQTLVELTHVSIRHEALEFTEKVLTLRGNLQLKYLLYLV